jgi:AcrR family transcriptional regulator
MTQNDAPNPLDERQLTAAQLVAEGRLTDEQIAAEAGVSRTTITRWKRLSAFQAAVEQAREALEAVILQQGIARRAQRVRALNDRWERMQRLLAARAAAPAMRGVTGGQTGLLVRHVRGLGSGENFTAVEEYEVDVGLLRELREHEKQAAQELGQWTEKHHHDGGPGVVVLAGVDLDLATGRKAADAPTPEE